MHRIVFALLLPVLAFKANAQYSDEPVLYQCDQARSRVRIDIAIDGRSPPALSGSPAPVKLPWPGFEPIDGERRAEKGLGPRRGPSEVTPMQCGKLEIRLRSEAFNDDPNGQDGAFSFGSVEILVEGRLLLARTHLAVCETDFPSSPSPGRCPDDFASSILLAFDAQAGSAQATIVRSFFDGSSEATSRTDELKDLRAAQRAEYAACSVQYDSTGCRKQQAALQKELSALYDQEERAVLSSLKDYEPEFREEAIRSLRETRQALAQYKDAECKSSPLLDGMSPRDSGVITDECKVAWRFRLVEAMRQRFARRVP